MSEGPVKLNIHQRPLSYAQRLDGRCTDDINLLVIHCTELPDLAMARVYGEKVHHTGTQTGNSGHFYIDRDGTVGFRSTVSLTMSEASTRKALEWSW